MTEYEKNIMLELQNWQRDMQKKPTRLDRISKNLQRKINSLIPDQIHAVITATIKQMTRGVLFGAGITTPQREAFLSMEQAETAVKARIEFYKKAGAVEGGIAGAGGFLLAIADFPILISLKLKLLFDIAALYGRPVDDYRERLFILHIFQLAFSSQQGRQKVYSQIADWSVQSENLPRDINQFDWTNFQQEYRDYIDLAKMAQLIPGIGAAVGLLVNYRLLNKLGKTAMNAYRMRWFEDTKYITNGYALN